MEETKNRRWALAARWLGTKIYEFALPLSLVAAVLTVHFYLGIVVARAPEFQIAGSALKKIGLVSGSRSMLDDRLPQSVRDEILKEAGVRRVSRVRRAFPGGFEVRVEARAGWIGVKTAGLFVMLDDQGVRLEGEFRQPPRTRTGLIVSGVASAAPAAGRAWNDDEIRVAFEMVRLVLTTPSLRPLIAEIDLTNLRGRSMPAEPEVVLISRSGCRVHWGSASPTPEGFEVATAEKLSNLSAIAQRYPSLAGLDYAKIYIRNRPTVRRTRSTGAMNQG